MALQRRRGRATAFIQRVYRGHLARKEARRRRYLRQCRAVAVIERAYRAFVARSLLRRMQLAIAAVVLQSLVRGFLARLYVVRMRELQRNRWGMEVEDARSKQHRGGEYCVLALSICFLLVQWRAG